MRTSIILAAGQAKRFSGTIKELLPVSETESVIDNSINASRCWGADRVIIVSNPDKIGYHIRHFNQEKYQDLNIIYKINLAGEMWQSLCKGLEDATEDNLILMADTVFTYRALEHVPTEDIVFGVFRTFAPAKYSVFVDGRIVTKDGNLQSREYTAWGCIAFTKAVVDYWRNDLYTHYDDAFNDAMEIFNYGVFSIGTYHDLGTFGSYVEYLNKHYV